jgi:Radical SAM superfamily
VPSDPAAPASVIRFELHDGRPATLLVGEASTVLSVGDALVSSWDLAGRPYALVRESGTFRRGLDGRLLRKREATADGPRVRQRLSAAEGEPIVEAARREAEAASLILRGSGRPSPEGSAIVARLRDVVAMDGAALRDDAARFLGASGPVGILPPDQYLSLVVRVTEGCSWNACMFCGLYRDVQFRWKSPDELAAHLAALRAYFGSSIALRRSVFLGDANALCLAHDRLLPLVETVSREHPGTPLFSFVDAWTGQRKTAAQWRDYAALGLRRVYVGLETGDPALLAWLEKPGSPQDAVELVGALHEAGLGAGVIVLLGAGGERFAEAHAARTAEALTAMRLGPDDLVYFSEYVDEPGLAYRRRAAGVPELQPLPPERDADLRRSILARLHPADPGRPPRSATYDIREFVY